MDVLNEVLHRVTGAHVQDVLLPGVLERDRGAVRHVAWPSEVYLELDVGLLRFASVGSRGGLQLGLTDHVVPPVELEDEDLEFSIASVGPFFIDTPPQVTCIRYAMNGESDAARGVVRCAEFQLGSTLRLFLDPMWIPGIQLATGDAYDLWSRTERADAEEFIWPPKVS